MSQCIYQWCLRDSVGDSDDMLLTVMGVDKVTPTSDDDTVGVTEFEARAASSASDVGNMCRKRSG